MAAIESQMTPTIQDVPGWTLISPLTKSTLV
jgi:hypothetical protein